jgi:DNA polymerase-3 subunit beta
MRIKFNTDELIPKLSVVTSVVNSKNAIPALDYVVVKTCGDSCVELMCSDSDTWVSEKVQNVEHDGEFSFCINAKDFLSVIKNLSGMSVELKLNEKAKTANGMYNNGMFTLPYDDVSVFPANNVSIVDAQKLSVYSKKLLDLISKAGTATASEELRPVMNGIYLDFFPTHTVGVSCNGARLVKYTDFTMIRGGGGAGLILPKKPANIISNILSGLNGDVILAFNDRYATVGNDEFMVTTRLIDGKYPNYESVIPKSSAFEVVVNKQEFVSALKRIVPMGDIASCLVRVVLGNNTLTISAEDSDFSKAAKENIPCQYDGDQFTIGFKGTSLLEMIQNIDDEKVRICMTSEKSACVLKPFTQEPSAEYISLLMPLIIS